MLTLTVNAVMVRLELLLSFRGYLVMIGCDPGDYHCTACEGLVCCDDDRCIDVDVDDDDDSSENLLPVASFIIAGLSMFVAVAL